MTITEQIESFKQKTAEFKAANPAIDNISWDIDNVPMAEFYRYADEVNKMPSFLESYNRMCITRCFDDGCTVHIMSVKVTFKQVVEQL